jgi:hypothetical protein
MMGWLNEHNVIVDVKKVADMDRFARHIEEFRYHVQDAMYREGALKVTACSSWMRRMLMPGISYSAGTLTPITNAASAMNGAAWKLLNALNGPANRICTYEQRNCNHQ